MTKPIGSTELGAISPGVRIGGMWEIRTMIKRRILIFKVDRALSQGKLLKAARLLNIDFMGMTNEQFAKTLLVQTTRLKMDPKMTDEEFGYILIAAGLDQ